ncbi:MAG: hypothetical protein K2N79_06020 [Muribaculaceae bacterium]|nr:hypothetical protein [Muribaculaceae bacterium]MDE7368411.1 hypothetical protein [Muribaculaceae bacterium]
MKRILLIITGLIAFTTVAQRNISIEKKALRFYDQQEWASASAMFDLLIEKDDASASDFAYAIVSAEMQNDTTSAMSLTEKSISHEIAIDSTFYHVRQLSFAQGMTALYENYLLQVKRHIPWMRRVADNYLMDYYTFRNNGPMMISYSELMLKGLPNDVRFLSTLARGYLIENQTDKAIETYHRILTVDPRNYQVMLILGNYYYDLYRENPSNLDNKKNAVKYLTDASAIQATPYVQNLLRSLEDKPSKK